MNSITSYGSYGSNLQAFAAAAPQWSGKSSGCSSLLESVAKALGDMLDQHAEKLVDKSHKIERGGDNPKALAEINAESQLMSIKSNVVHGVVTAIGEALKTASQK